MERSLVVKFLPHLKKGSRWEFRPPLPLLFQGSILFTEPYILWLVLFFLSPQISLSWVPRRPASKGKSKNGLDIAWYVTWWLEHCAGKSERYSFKHPGGNVVNIGLYFPGKRFYTQILGLKYRRVCLLLQNLTPVSHEFWTIYSFIPYPLVDVHKVHTFIGACTST